MWTIICCRGEECLIKFALTDWSKYQITSDGGLCTLLHVSHNFAQELHMGFYTDVSCEYLAAVY
jgi:hypothetical protein